MADRSTLAMRLEAYAVVLEQRFSGKKQEQLGVEMPRDLRAAATEIDRLGAAWRDPLQNSADDD